MNPEKLPYRFHISESGDDTPPEELAPFVGLKVQGAWMLPYGMFFSFEGAHCFEIEAVQVVGLKAAYCLKIGESKPGTDWHALLDDKLGQGPHEVFLRGLPFLGMDRDVLMFGECAIPVGVQISVGSIRWVKAVPRT